MEPDYSTQAGMERSIRAFIRQLGEDCPGSLCQMLSPGFVDCSLAGQSVTMSYPIREWMRNPGGVMHGGAIAAAMDTTMGVLIYYFDGEKMPPTINMQSNFQRPVPLGSTLYVRARATAVCRTMCYAVSEAWVDDAPDRLLVTATGVYHIPSSK